MHACNRQGKGNPLQYSCLENLRDRGAWWAAFYGVAQSWKWLKRLGSSSRGIICQYDKSLYDKPTANITFNWERLKAFPLRSGKKQGCPLPPFLFNSRGSISQNNLSEKKQKQIGKEDIKLSLFADDIILCIENPKDSSENSKTQ